MSHLGGEAVGQGCGAHLGVLETCVGTKGWEGGASSLWRPGTLCAFCVEPGAGLGGRGRAPAGRSHKPCLPPILLPRHFFLKKVHTPISEIILDVQKSCKNGAVPIPSTQLPLTLGFIPAQRRHLLLPVADLVHPSAAFPLVTTPTTLQPGLLRTSPGGLRGWSVLYWVCLPVPCLE